MTTIAAPSTLTAAPVMSKRAKWVPILLVLSTFGPYLAGQIRTEQVAVYGLLLVVFPFTFMKLHVSGGVRFLLPWLLYVLFATIAVIVPTPTLAPYNAGSLLGGYDNLLAPIAVMLLIWSTVAAADAATVLTMVTKVLSIAIAVNGVLAIVATRIDLAPILSSFWTSAAETGSTAENAAALGRFGGIFNQPVEAGLMHGIGGIAAIYAWHHRPVLLMLLVSVITLGGLISVSKVFILGGIPAILIYWFWSQRGGKKIFTFFGLGLAALAVLQSGIIDQWSGANYLGRLFAVQDGDFLAFYSAGRYEDESQVSRVIGHALESSPIVGVGAGGWQVPYDSAIVESLVTGGVLGLAMYAAIIIGMLTIIPKLSGHERMFAFTLTVITVAGAAGFSPFTANRTGTVLWLLIALLVLAIRARKEEQAVAAVLPTR